MRIALTDLTIQRLKFEKQTRVHDTTLRGFGVLVSKSTKTFFVVTGKERKLTTLGRYPAMGLREARTRAKAVQVAETEKVASPTPSTFLEARSAFLTACAKRVKKTTLAQYTRYLDSVTFSSFPPTRGEVHEALAALDGKPAAQNYLFVSLKNFFNWSLTEGFIQAHPLLRVRPPNKLKSRERVLTDTELRDIWVTAANTTFGTLMRLLILTGMRRGELIRAKDTGDLLVVEDTKNGTTHSLPITPLIRAHLPVKPRFGNWSGAKASFDEKCGVEGWVIHDLRRTLATNMARLGVGEHIIERILNHTVQGVKGVYQRYRYLPEMREALLTYEAHILTITKPGHQPEPCTAPLGVGHEGTEQKGATSQDNDLNTAHHSAGEVGEVSETNPIDAEQGGVA